MSFGLSRGRDLDTTGYGRDQSELPPFDAGRLDPRRWFVHPERPFELEIGSGKGTFVLQESGRRPEVNFLGIEWAKEFYTYAADRLRRHAPDNALMLRADATEFIRWWCADGIAEVIHLYFSDPWPKSRHHKRRVVQDATLREFHRLLSPEGELRIVTDHDELWAWTEEHAARAVELFERRPFDRPASAGEDEIVGTNFERKYRREGRPFHAMALRKRPLAPDRT